MSASFALIKFKKTGNIYYGCYEGTSDVLLPYICTPEECYNKNIDCYCPITYCRELTDRAANRSWIISDDELKGSYLDDVEIYSDYGGGFYWKSSGCEAFKKVNVWGTPYDDGCIDYADGVPDWAKEFLEEETNET